MYLLKVYTFRYLGVPGESSSVWSLAWASRYSCSLCLLARRINYVDGIFQFFLKHYTSLSWRSNGSPWKGVSCIYTCSFLPGTWWMVNSNQLSHSLKHSILEGRLSWFLVLSRGTSGLWSVWMVMCFPKTYIVNFSHAHAVARAFFSI